LLAGPDGPAEARLAYVICEAADSARGVPYCLGDALAHGELEKSLTAPEVVFSIPPATPLATRYAVLGVGCEEGEPVLADDPLDWTCVGGGRPLRFSFDFWTAGGSGPLVNPDLRQLQGDIGGASLTLSESGEPADCDAGAAVVPVGETSVLRLELGEISRSAAGADTALQLSHFASNGLYERQYSIVTADEPTVVELEWEAPSEPGASKHYLVVRDGLGGVTWATWSVCAATSIP
jgi:hypothetical protein